MIVYSLSPTTIMMWQGLILLHAAILPVILWAGALGRSRLAPRVLTGTRVYTVVAIVFLVAMALGGSQYRCGGHTGEDGFGFNLPLRQPDVPRAAHPADLPLAGERSGRVVAGRAAAAGGVKGLKWNGAARRQPRSP